MDWYEARISLECRITHGLHDWQILQRNADGYAEVTVGGTWRPFPEDPAPTTVIVRVVSEDTCAPISQETDWQKAETRPDGTWAISLRVPTGGLYRLETGLQTNFLEWAYHGDTVHHFGVGDLWIIAGQSNAAGYGRGAVHDPCELGVHILRNDETWSLATHPLNDTRGNLHRNLELSNPGHAPFLLFAKLLKKELGYPIGLIQTAQGGSPLAEWNPVGNPALLYQNLLHCVRLAGGKARGMVWYQGESETANTALASSYQEKFTEFLSSLRRDLGDADFPVITAQLNHVGDPPVPEVAVERDLVWSLVREAQRRIARDSHRVAIVGTLDLVLSDVVHNSAASNLILGHRYARAALGLAYGRDIHYRFPEISRAERDGDNAVQLVFANVVHRLHSEAWKIEQFTIEDAAGLVPLEATKFTAPDTILLTFSRPLQMPAVAHGSFGSNPVQQVYENDDIRPVLGFHGFPVE